MKAALLVPVRVACTYTHTHVHTYTFNHLHKYTHMCLSTTRECFVSKVREALAAAGIEETKFAGYSFRIGVAIIVAQSGMNDATIQILGRWEITAYFLYMRTPCNKLAAVSATIGK